VANWKHAARNRIALRRIAISGIVRVPRAPADAVTSLHLALLMVAGLMIVAACSAMSIGLDPQDACRVGAISPEESRTIAAEMASQPPIDWDAALEVRYPSDGVAAALRERLEQVLNNRANEDEQIAAMHAQMRSIGAELRYAQRSTDSTVAGYRYRLDVNRIGMTRLLVRWAQIHIRFEWPPGHGDRPALERVVAMMPEMFEPGWPGWKKPPQEELCPPPSAALTFEGRRDRYNQRP
jgi:hypothetical protein